MPTLAITIAAGIMLAAVAALFLMIGVAIEGEDRRMRGLLAPAPGYLAWLTRRIVGLHYFSDR